MRGECWHAPAAARSSWLRPGAAALYPLLVGQGESLASQNRPKPGFGKPMRLSGQIRVNAPARAPGSGESLRLVELAFRATASAIFSSVSCGTRVTSG